MFNKIVRLEEAEQLDLSQNAILDPIPQDFLTKKVQLTLQAIGYPASATADPRVLEALGEVASKRSKPSLETPASRILWQTAILSEQRIERNIASLRKTLEVNNFHLNDSQWQAWERALTRQFVPIWGPPVPGKAGRFAIFFWQP
ncbi:MAG: hypothetical protein HC828_05790 [Blastochloris sp.]|nr:hypothetical protein [Blastochloris sp.]